MGEQKGSIQFRPTSSQVRNGVNVVGIRCSTGETARESGVSFSSSSSSSSSSPLPPTSDAKEDRLVILGLSRDAHDVK